MGNVSLERFYVTRKVKERMAGDNEFEAFVNAARERYKNGDWGDTWEENAKRILAFYKQSGTENVILITTEWDGDITTVMFPEEF